VGQEVHTPPCLVQKEHVQARAGISTGSGSHSNSNAMFPQWQLPAMSKGAPRAYRLTKVPMRWPTLSATQWLETKPPAKPMPCVYRDQCASTRLFFQTTM